MMNKKIKAKWLTALKSGDYRQGRMELKNGPEFCCLGVLCDLYIKETGKGEWEDSTFASVEDFDHEDENLPNGVREWAELPSCDPQVTIGDGQKVNISRANDGYTGSVRLGAKSVEKHSFAEIAVFIQEQL